MTPGWWEGWSQGEPGSVGQDVAEPRELAMAQQLQPCCTGVVG